MPKTVVLLWISSLIIIGSFHKVYAQDTPSANDKKAGYILRYALNGGKTWRYDVLKIKNTELEIPKIGMDLSSKSTTKKSYTLNLISQDSDKHLKLSVSINDISVITQSGSGEADIDFSDVKGKAFHLILTDLGQEIKYEGIKDLNGKIKTRSGKTVNIGIENFFYNILMDLPEKKVNQGDAWKTEKCNTIINEDGVEQTIVYQVLYTFEELIKMDDRLCLKIKKYSAGTLTGAGIGSSGVSENYSEFFGEFEGFGTIYFDPEAGVVTKTTATNSIKGEVTIRSFMGQYTEPFNTREIIEISLVQ